jgi:hypothetical protein
VTHDPIAYTYEADVHCRACTIKRFGRHTANHGARACGLCETDTEGNAPGPIFAWEEVPVDGLHCGDCCEAIA